MLICIDESGSIDNKNDLEKFFLITLVRVKGKGTLRARHKKFVSKYFDKLKQLDESDKKKKCCGEKVAMFEKDGTFRELKGFLFDDELKHTMVDFFINSKSFELFYIKIINAKLTDTFCSKKERVFNYVLKTALEYFIKCNYLPGNECYHLNLDNRNIKTNSKMVLEEYLQTELQGDGLLTEHLQVVYCDSSQNKLVQIADIFSNLYYTNFFNNEFEADIQRLREAGIIKKEFVFPLENKINIKTIKKE